jgi:hypothetical protein
MVLCPLYFFYIIIILLLFYDLIEVCVMFRIRIFGTNITGLIIIIYFLFIRYCRSSLIRSVSLLKKKCFLKCFYFLKDYSFPSAIFFLYYYYYYSLVP